MKNSFFDGCVRFNTTPWYQELNSLKKLFPGLRGPKNSIGTNIREQDQTGPSESNVTKLEQKCWSKTKDISYKKEKRKYGKVLNETNISTALWNILFRNPNGTWNVSDLSDMSKLVTRCAKIFLENPFHRLFLLPLQSLSTAFLHKGKNCNKFVQMIYCRILSSAALMNLVTRCTKLFLGKLVLFPL